MRGPITIFDRLGYRIDSYGNGAAYTLTRLADNASVFFQYGDDASAFRSEFDAAGSCSDDVAVTDRAIRDCLSAYDDVMTVED